jgi:molecular chaperone GrpE
LVNSVWQKKTDEPQQELQQEIDTRIEDLENQLKRSVADYRNLEKRVEEEKREVIKFANRELLLQLLPAFETLIIAEKYVEDEGLKLTIKRVIDVLRSVGVERIETIGKEYNAEQMEVIDIVEGEENKVLEETRPGFRYNDKTLVPAQVKVGKSKDKE